MKSSRLAIILALLLASFAVHGVAHPALAGVDPCERRLHESNGSAHSALFGWVSHQEMRQAFDRNSWTPRYGRPHYQAADFGSRFERGDPFVHELLDHMGWETTTAHGTLEVRPPTDFGRFVTTINDYPPGVPEEGRFYAVTRFVHQATREEKWLRIGIDPIPPESEWLWKDGGEISHETWARLMTQRMMPFSFGMMDHDYSHFTDLKRNPAIADATATLYILPQTAGWIGKAGGSLVDLVFEFITVAHPAKWSEIERLFSKYFETQELTKPEELYSDFEKEFPTELLDFVIQKGESLIAAHGGAARDASYLSRANENETADAYLWPILRSPSPYFSQIEMQGIAGSARSLLYYHLKEVRGLRDLLSRPELIARWSKWLEIDDAEELIRARMLGRLSVFCAAIINSTKLKLTGAKVMRRAFGSAEEVRGLLDYFKTFSNEANPWVRELSSTLPSGP